MVNSVPLVQGPEPVHAGMLTEYMRTNLGQLLKPRGDRPEQEPQQPTLRTQLSGDDDVKVTHWLCFTSLTV